MKKKYISLLLVTIIILTCLCSCTKNADTSSEDTATTESTAETTIAEVFDISLYEGSWSESGLSWQSGGFLLDLSIENDILTVYLLLTGSAPSSKLAEVSAHAAVSAVDNQTLTATFDNDNWGNSGILTLTFLDDKISCTLSDVTYYEEGSYPVWGMYDCEIELVRNDNAHSDLSYTMEDYYELYPEEKPTEQPVYDTSKASGILAQSGLTEQEFRNICTYIGSSSYKNNAYVYAAGREYYAQHPEENTLLDNCINDWNNYQLNGKEPEYYKEEIKKSNSLDDFLNRTIYGSKGASILGKQSQEIFERMREYPNDYANQPFLLKNFNVESSYGDTYFDENYVLYGVTTSVIDYRDDVNYPNILERSYYDMYVMFLGTDGNNGLVFALLSVDKCDT